MATFLIVDDDRSHREALAIGLRLDGHEVAALGDADAAGALLAARRFDCCVVDGFLPGADALLEAAARAGVHAVAIGPYPDLLAASAARHPSAQPLAKPIGAAELAARLAGASAP